MSLITPQGHGLGLVKQAKDRRDLVFVPKPGARIPGTLPAHVDLRTSPFRPPIWDQGQLGACTSFAGARIAEQTYGIDGFHNQFEPAHLFIYFNSRALEGSIAADSGATMRDAMKAIAQQGICAEHFWPYSAANPGPFSQQPPQEAYTNALKHTALQYRAVNLDIGSIKACLAAGYPFMFGIDVHASFEGQQASATGIIPMPILDSPADPVLGGHAATAQGYDDVHQWVICDNSWGSGWGDHGSYYLPYSYITNPNLAFDGWTIRIQH